MKTDRHTERHTHRHTDRHTDMEKDIKNIKRHAHNTEQTENSEKKTDIQYKKKT